MLFEKLLVTSRYPPEGSTITPVGPLPAGVGVAFCDKVPSLAILNSEIVLAEEFATYKNLLIMASPCGETPTVCGVCATVVISPVIELICTKSTEPWLGKVI